MDAAVFGNIVADVIGEPMDLRQPPRRGSLQFLNSIVLSTGGSVCNVGLAMAKLGMSVAAAGLVGNDILGQAMLARLKDAGLDTSSVFTTDKSNTSATMVAVQDGERTFFHAPGATQLLDADAFRKCFPIFRQCAWVHIGYFGLLPGMTTDLPQLLDELRQTAPGTKIALDTIDPPGGWKQLEPILPRLNLFAPSRPEAMTLSGEDEPKKMVAFFRKHMPAGLIAIKLDADGCYLDDGYDAVHVPAYKIKVVDSTGAGDSWYAGLLVGLRQNMSLEQAAKLANRTAADCCTAIGASTGIQPLKETLARL